jgi:microcystin-dependent protein
MPTLYPTGLDAPANPTQTTSMAAPGFEHDLQHVNINDAMRAIQSYLGTTNSPVPASITYVSNNNSANITVLQGSVSTLNQQLTITNANVTANTNTLSSHTASISNLIATKLNLAGGTLSGAVTVSYKPPAVSASLYLSAQVLVSNTGSGDSPPSIGWAAVGALGIAIYANANGLNTITGTGGSTLIIDNAGRLNPLSIPDNTLPASKLVNASVNTAALAAASVTGPIIAAGAVDPTKFSASVSNWARDNAGVPVGTMVPFAGPNTSVVFPNWLPCIGSAISRTAYSTLYAYLGGYWGNGDGSTTFNIPEMRGRFPLGASYYNTATGTWLANPGPGTTGAYPGTVGGAETHVLTTAEMPSHAHGVSDPTHAHSIYDPGHAHSISDPGHAHSLAQNAHTHSDAGHTHVYSQAPIPGPQIQSGGGDWAVRPVAANTGVGYANIQANTIGIGVYAAGTGIGIYGAGTGIGIYAAGTGISIAAAGGGAAHSIMPPFAGVTYIIKVLPN